MSEWCQVLEIVLAYLRNKDWVTIEEIIEQMELTKAKGIKVLDFLYEFKFTKFDASKGKIKIDDSALKLLNIYNH